MYEIDWLPDLTYANFNLESLTTYSPCVTKNAKIASHNLIDSLSCEISDCIPTGFKQSIFYPITHSHFKRGY